MDRYKVHRIVEYIRMQTEFPFDVMDVDEDVEQVLAYFGLHPALEDEERQEIQRELGEIAGEAQLAEIARLVTEAELLSSPFWASRAICKWRSFTSKPIKGVRSSRAPI